jgi:hypothetical protein
MQLFKKITNWDLSKNPADTLAWLDELNSLDDLTALNITIQRMEDCLKDRKISDLDRLKTLSAIDQHNRRRMAKITTQYTKFDNLKPELKARISELAYTYYRQTYLIYFGLIEKFISEPDQHIFDYEWLQMLLGRAVNAATGMIKWRAFTQMPAPAHVWLQMFTIYRIAVNENLLYESTALFEDEPSITLGSMLAQLFMLGSLDKANINCQQVQIVSQLLRLWLPTAQIHKNYDADNYLFFIDITKDTGARRIRNLELDSNCRYLDIQHFNFLVGDAIADLELKQRPEHLGLHEFTDHKVLLDTLKILRNEWSKSEYKRQRRREDRSQSTKSATICHGVAEVCQQVHNLANYNLTRGARLSAEGKSLDERLASHSVVKSAPNIYFTGSNGDNWPILDESHRGYGVRVDKELARELTLGRLVGVVLKDQKNQIAIGLIKTIKPMSHEQCHMGIEIISRNPSWCQLVHMKRSDPNIDEHYGPAGLTQSHLLAFPALYLPQEEGLSEHSRLLVPRIEFAKNENYQVSCMGVKSLITLAEVLEAQGDWVQVAIDALTPNP